MRYGVRCDNNFIHLFLVTIQIYFTKQLVRFAVYSNSERENLTIGYI